MTDTHQPESRSVVFDHPAVRLLPRPNEQYDSTSATAPWRLGHIAAVRAYLAGRGSGYERSILSLLDGLDRYVTEYESGLDPLQTEEFAPALVAARSLLNWDLGRLDGGTLDRWVADLYDRIGWDADLDQPKDREEA